MDINIFASGQVCSQLAMRDSYSPEQSFGLLAVIGIWRINQQVRDLSFPIFSCFSKKMKTIFLKGKQHQHNCFHSVFSELCEAPWLASFLNSTGVFLPSSLTSLWAGQGPVVQNGILGLASPLPGNLLEMHRALASDSDRQNGNLRCNKIPRLACTLKFEKHWLCYDWGFSLFHSYDVIYFRQLLCLIINPAWSDSVAYPTLYLWQLAEAMPMCPIMLKRK